MAYYVYILASRKDGATYVGITNDLVRRVYEHRQKAVPGFISRYNITQLVWFEIYEGPVAAISREKELKKWTRDWKTQLSEGKIQSGSTFTIRFVSDLPVADSTEGPDLDLEIPGSCFARPGMTK